MSKIAVYDVDSKIPNLALMKISQWHKENGDEVEFYNPLWLDTFDKIYASAIFNFSNQSYLLPERMLIGGTGWGVTINLPPQFEAMIPDYKLYNYPHSIGFTMRGCRFNCGFCVVPEKEGKPKPYNTIEEIWINRNSNCIVLLDNDFFGNPQWKERIKEIRNYNLNTSICQGMNIRIITDEQAEYLSTINNYNINFNTKQYSFAWDRIKDEKLVRNGIKRVIKAGIKPYLIRIYILIGYDTTPKEDFHRVSTIWNDYGCDPFVMPYDKKNLYQRRFTRWVNHKAIFKSVNWNDYK